MDRRSFLKAILGAAAYEPAKKIFVFAPACGWNSSLIVPGEALFFLESTAHGYNDWKFFGGSEMRMPFTYDNQMLTLAVNAYRDTPFIPVTNVRT